MSKVHDLKCSVTFFPDVWHGTKPFEVRKNDRDYQVGDVLLLNEYDPMPGVMTGRVATRRVTYILDHADFHYGLQPGYVVMGLAVISNHTKGRE